MKKLGLLLLILSISTLTNAKENPKLIALKFHADWCKSCQAMGSVFTDLEQKMQGKPVEFVKLDFTNEETKATAMKKVNELGLQEVVKKHLGTGFILIVDADTLKPLESLKKKHSLDKMEELVLARL